ncbi:MAG: hypothetical protein ACRDTT_19645 [Pseudonocardiaceae bacterium]
MSFGTWVLPMVGLRAAQGRLPAATTTAARPAAPEGGAVVIDGGAAHWVELTVAELPGS